MLKDRKNSLGSPEIKAINIVCMLPGSFPKLATNFGQATVVSTPALGVLPGRDVTSGKETYRGVLCNPIAAPEK